MSANKALKAWKGETTEDSPPKSRGLAVISNLHSLWKIKGTAKRENVLKVNKKQLKLKVSLLL